MFNFRLKELREEKRVTQQALADALDCAQQSVNNYENRGGQPDLEMLCKIADYFDTSVDYLLGATNVRSKYPKEEFAEGSEEAEDIICKLRLLPPEVRKHISEELDLFLNLQKPSK